MDDHDDSTAPFCRASEARWATICAMGRVSIAKFLRPDGRPRRTKEFAWDIDSSPQQTLVTVWSETLAALHL